MHFGVRVVCVVALVALATTIIAARLPGSATGIDDANIFFVYARHVSAGDGFVFNPGGERVEGFTSLLWVLIAGAATAIGGSPETPLLVLNVLLVSATVLLCLRGLSTLRAAVFLILLLSDPSFMVWHTSALMETALWSALLTTLAMAGAQPLPFRCESRALAIVSALLVLTRPEALVWVPALLALLFFARSDAATTARGLRRVGSAVVAFIGTAAALTIFRLLYFGFPLPNTFYAKVSPSLVYRLSEGIRYLTSYINSSVVVLSCAVAVGASAVHLVKVRFADARTLALTGAAACGLVVPVLTGGDHFGGFRCYQPIFPLLLLTLLNFFGHVVPAYLPAVRFTPAWRRAALGSVAVAVGTVVVLQLVTWLSLDPSAILGREFDIAAAGRRVGRRANVVFGNGRHPGIATITVGGLKYAYKGNVIDLMGLNDTRVAHNGGDRIGFRSHAAFEVRTFFELKPDVIIPLVQHSDSLSAAGRTDLFTRTVLKGLLDEPRFRDGYRLAEVRRSTGDGVVTLSGWYERTFLAQLRRAGDLEVIVDSRSD